MPSKKLRRIAWDLRARIVDDLDYLLEKKLKKGGVVSVGIYIEYDDGAVELYGYDIIRETYSPFVKYDMRYVELSPIDGVLRGYFKTYDTRDNTLQPRKKRKDKAVVESGEEFLITEEEAVFRHPREFSES